MKGNACFLLCRAMASRAASGQDGLNVAGEIDFVRHGDSSNQEHQSLETCFYIPRPLKKQPQIALIYLDRLIDLAATRILRQLYC